MRRRFPIYTKSKAAWLRERRKLITASDVPSLMGINRFKRPMDVFWEKLHGAVDLSSNPNIERGHVMERAILCEYERRVDLRTKPLGSLWSNRDYPWLGATPDAVDSMGFLVEIKCPAKAPLEDYKEEAFKRYEYQLLAQLLVTEKRFGAIVAATADMAYFEIRTVDMEARQEQVAEMIRLTRLWHGFILAKEAPIEYW